MGSSVETDRSPIVAIDDDLRRAIATSNLGRLPSELAEQLLAGARRVNVPAAQSIHGEGEPHVDIVVAGLVRAYITGPDGRTMTIRYCRPGDLLGVATLYIDPTARPFALQALVDSRLLLLDARTVRRLAARDPRFAEALLTETSERVLAFVTEISGYAFATVRQRVARHLLDLASDRQTGGALVARISQSELADAAGTAREVVVRCLRELREEGTVETSRAAIVILAPERLVGEG